MLSISTRHIVSYKSIQYLMQTLLEHILLLTDPSSLRRHLLREKDTKLVAPSLSPTPISSLCFPIGPPVGPRCISLLSPTFSYSSFLRRSISPPVGVSGRAGPGRAFGPFCLASPLVSSFLFLSLSLSLSFSSSPSLSLRSKNGDCSSA